MTSTGLTQGVLADTDAGMRPLMPGRLCTATDTASVRVYDDPVWSLPSLSELVKVTIAPVGR